MNQQRARMEARRTRFKKLKSDIKKYGSGSKPAVTRDTSKDQSKKELAAIARYGSGSKKGVTRDTSKDSKPPKAGGKTGADVLRLGGSNVKKGTLTKSNGDGTYGNSLPSNPQLKSQNRGKAGMPYQGVFPGTPKKEEPKRTLGAGTRGRQGGSRARVNRKRTKPTEGSSKTIQVGPKRVTMVYKGGKWVRK